MENIAVELYEEKYQPDLAKWLVHDSLMKLMDMGPFTEDQATVWPDQDGKVVLIVIESSTMTPVGFTNFHHFNADRSEASVGILVHPIYQGRGYGKVGL